jgi:hypothetical protein
MITTVTQNSNNNMKEHDVYEFVSRMQRYYERQLAKVTDNYINQISKLESENEQLLKQLNEKKETE